MLHAAISVLHILMYLKLKEEPEAHTLIVKSFIIKFEKWKHDMIISYMVGSIPMDNLVLQE